MPFMLAVAALSPASTPLFDGGGARGVSHPIALGGAPHAAGIAPGAGNKPSTDITLSDLRSVPMSFNAPLPLMGDDAIPLTARELTSASPPPDTRYSTELNTLGASQHAVAEPTCGSLLGGGGILLAVLRRRRRTSTGTNRGWDSLQRARLRQFIPWSRRG